MAFVQAAKLPACKLWARSAPGTGKFGVKSQQAQHIGGPQCSLALSPFAEMKRCLSLQKPVISCSCLFTVDAQSHMDLQSFQQVPRPKPVSLRKQPWYTALRFRNHACEGSLGSNRYHCELRAKPIEGLFGEHPGAEPDSVFLYRSLLSTCYFLASRRKLYCQLSETSKLLKGVVKQKG